MTDLHSEDHCCDANPAALSEKKAVEYLSFLTGWTLLETDAEKTLAKTYATQNFKEAVKFANAIELISQEFNHHPRLDLSYSKISVFWKTHDLGGLTDLDFASAEACDAIFAEMQET